MHMICLSAARHSATQLIPTLMWHEVSGTWCAEAAVTMYKDALLPALKKARPDRAARRGATWTLMADTDPTGYKSRKAVQRKEEFDIQAMIAPKCSPDFNVLDYRIWVEVNRCMRRTQRGWPRSYNESWAAYKDRLKRIALSLLRSFVRKAVADMKRRCELLTEAKGWHFQE